MVHSSWAAKVRAAKVRMLTLTHIARATSWASSGGGGKIPQWKMWEPRHVADASLGGRWSGAAVGRSVRRGARSCGSGEGGEKTGDEMEGEGGEKTGDEMEG